MESSLISPCITVCRTDPVSGFCYGCGRTSEDKEKWKDPNTTDDWKKNNLKELLTRLTGWQLEAFNKSYEYKKSNGISLIKKKINEVKKI